MGVFSGKSILIKTNIYRVPILQTNGRTITILAYGMDKLTSCIKLMAKAEIWITSKKLENVVVERETPGILIGMKYFWDMVKPETVKRLRNGLRTIETTVGTIICGSARK